MKLLFWRKHGRHKKQQLDAIDKQAKLTHEKNISKIVKSRKDAGKLITELKRNNITLELAKATGH